MTLEEAIALAKMAGYEVQIKSKYQVRVHFAEHPEFGRTYRRRKVHKKRFWQSEDNRKSAKHHEMSQAVMDGIMYLNDYKLVAYQELVFGENGQLALATRWRMEPKA